MLSRLVAPEQKAATHDLVGCAELGKAVAEGRVARDVTREGDTRLRYTVDTDYAEPCKFECLIMQYTVSARYGGYGWLDATADTSAKMHFSWLSWDDSIRSSS